MTVAPGIFREYDIRGVYGDDLTVETAYAVGRAYAVFLTDASVRGAVAVGRDNRPSGAVLRDALVGGLTESGVHVVDVGVVPTPVMYWSLEHLDVAGGIQVTASHNPPQYNGFKICVGTRALYGDDIQRLLAIHQSERTVDGRGEVTPEDVIERYVDDLAGRIGRISRPLRIVLDGANGVGAAPMSRLLDRLGVQFTCLYCESDGTFPNHLPDPSVEANLAGLIAAVRRTPVDLGIALDGDADRIGVVDREGRVVWGDRLLIVYARDILARSAAGAPIVFDVKCSDALAEAVRAAGGTPVMWKTGHSLIEAKMTEIGSPLAGELSGHMYIADGYYGFDDAIYAAARLLKIVADGGRSIDELLAGVPVYPSTPEIRVECGDDIKFGIVDRAIAHFKETHDVIDVDGARVQFGDGWGLIRASNTQPALVLRFEARTAERLAAIQREMQDWLRAQGVHI